MHGDKIEYGSIVMLAVFKPLQCAKYILCLIWANLRTTQQDSLSFYRWGKLKCKEIKEMAEFTKLVRHRAVCESSN